jgi:D-alanyl-D-alanine carboxypeptidase
MHRSALTRCVAFALGLAAMTGTSRAGPTLVVDAATGAVLHEQEAARPWYPASLTKLMTAYVALKAVKSGRITLDAPIVVSVRASRAPPSKMAFRPGQEVTLDNALKMLMVKSANDVAITIAEGISGTVEDFAAEMNQEAARIGMRDSHFVNPNGLHDANHVSSARDMALIGMALLRDFPEMRDLYGIGALRIENRIIPTHNGMLGRYPGADGMKTGFTCSSGFNVVSTATRNGRKLMVVVMGSPNAKARTLKAMSLLETAFNASTWGRPSITSLGYMGSVAAPNMRPEVCGKNRAPGDDEDFAIPIASNGPATHDDSPVSFFAADMSRQTVNVAASELLRGPRPAFEPVDVFVGRNPGYIGPVAKARGVPTPDPAEFAAKEKPIRAAAKPPVRSAKPLALAAKPVAAKPIAALTKPAPKAEPKKPAAKAVAKPDPKAQKPASGQKPAAKPKTQAEAKPAQVVATTPVRR